MTTYVQDIGKIVKNGLWGNNQALVALLGLCPLLAVTTTAINALGLGLATMLVLLMTNVIIALVRQWLINEIRIPVFVLIIASSVTSIELLMSAHLHELYRVLGIFIPLIVTNCAVIGRAEAYASRNTTWRAALDGISMGLGFTIVLFVLGAIREVIGYGTLFRQSTSLFGEGSEWMTLTLFEGNGFLLAILPPGAFLGLAVLIALKNRIDRVRRPVVSTQATTAQQVELQRP